MCCKIAHHLSPSGDQCPPASSLHFTQSMTFCVMEYSFGHFGSAVLVMLLPGLLGTFSLAKHGKLERHWLRVSTIQQKLKHHCYQHHSHSMAKKHSTVPATGRKLTLSQLKPRHTPKSSGAIVTSANILKKKKKKQSELLRFLFLSIFLTVFLSIK